MNHHPYSSVLRHRAARLHDLADRLERTAVMSLADPPNELAARLLDRNRHQLGLAGAELRDSAEMLRRRADDLDLAVLVAS